MYDANRATVILRQSMRLNQPLLIRVFCGEFGWVRFLVVYFPYKTNLDPRKMICCGKKWPNATFNLIFLGLGWPWVREFVGFIIFFMLSNPTEFR